MFITLNLLLFRFHLVIVFIISFGSVHSSILLNFIHYHSLLCNNSSFYCLLYIMLVFLMFRNFCLLTFYDIYLNHDIYVKWYTDLNQQIYYVEWLNFTYLRSVPYWFLNGTIPHQFSFPWFTQRFYLLINPDQNLEYNQFFSQ